MIRYEISKKLVKFENKDEMKYLVMSAKAGLIIFSIELEEVIEILMVLNENNSTICKLISTLNNKNTEEIEQGEIAKILISIHKNKNISNLLKLIDNETVDLCIQIEVFEALIHLDKIDKKIINKFILKIKDKDVSENEQQFITKSLIYLAKHKNFISELTTIVRDEHIDFYVRKSIAIQFSNDIDFIN
jgi:hypothetical protein